LSPAREAGCSSRRRHQSNGHGLYAHGGALVARAASIRRPVTVMGRRTQALGPQGETVTKFCLLADAEVAEDYVEQIFDIDRTGNPAEAAQGQAEIFGA